MASSKKGKYSILQRAVIDTSSLFGNGKTHVPISIRNLLGVTDGSGLVWIIEAERVFVESSNKHRKD